VEFICIGDEDTVRGFRLAGITAVAVTTADQARAILGDAVASPDCGIVIITERTAALIRPEVDAVRLERARPLILEIPGPEGPMAGRKSLREFVQEAVGMRIG